MSEKMNRRNFLKFSFRNGVLLSNLSIFSGVFEGIALAGRGEGSGTPKNPISSAHIAFWRTLEREFSSTLTPAALDAGGDVRRIRLLLDMQKNAFVTLKTSSFSLLQLRSILQKEKGGFSPVTLNTIRKAQSPARAAIERMQANLRAVRPLLPSSLSPERKEEILSQHRDLVTSLLSQPAIAGLLDEDGRHALEELFAGVQERFAKEGYGGLLELGEDVLRWSASAIDGEGDEEMPLFIERYLDAVLTAAFRTLETLCGWIPVPFFESLCNDFINQAILSPILSALIFSMLPTILLWDALCPHECTEQQVLILNIVFVINAILAFLYALKVLYDMIFGEPINPARSRGITPRDVVRIVRLIEEF